MNNDSMSIENLFYTWNDDFFQLSVNNNFTKNTKNMVCVLERKMI